MISRQETKIETYCDETIGEALKALLKDYSVEAPGDIAELVICRHEKQGVYFGNIHKYNEEPLFSVKVTFKETAE